jgi:hypothetical protein
MAESENAPWLLRPTPQAVVDSTGETTFAVHPGAWATVAPDLPPEVAAMVAPPISVSSGPVRGQPSAAERRRAELRRYRSNMPSPPPADGRHRRPAGSR